MAYNDFNMHQHEATSRTPAMQSMLQRLLHVHMPSHRPTCSVNSLSYSTTLCENIEMCTKCAVHCSSLSHVCESETRVCMTGRVAVQRSLGQGNMMMGLRHSFSQAHTLEATANIGQPPLPECDDGT